MATFVKTFHFKSDNTSYSDTASTIKFTITEGELIGRVRTIRLKAELYVYVPNNAVLIHTVGGYPSPFSYVTVEVNGFSTDSVYNDEGCDVNKWVLLEDTTLQVLYNDAGECSVGFGGGVSFTLYVDESYETTLTTDFIDAYIYLTRIANAHKPSQNVRVYKDGRVYARNFVTDDTVTKIRITRDGDIYARSFIDSDKFRIDKENCSIHATAFNTGLP